MIDSYCENSSFILIIVFTQKIVNSLQINCKSIAHMTLKIGYNY